MSTNLIKDTKFRVGGYARSHQWGTRVYKVINEFMLEEPFYRWSYKQIPEGDRHLYQGVSVSYDSEGNKHYHVRDEEIMMVKRVLHVTLMKVGETNKGNFRFTAGKPFTVYAPHSDGKYHWWSKKDTLTWYYPAKPIKQNFGFDTKRAHV